MNLARNCLLVVGVLACSAYGANPISGEGPDFPAFDAASAANVNEGTLRFLEAPPRKAVHHHHNDVVITDQSLDDGWTRLHQCHENLDQVSALEIVFNPDRIRNLQVESFHGVQRAWVEGASVQLRQVGPGARVCLKAEGRALRDNGDGTFSLASGPFMRKFLDGYYPMRVSMTVRVLTSQIRFLQIDPPPQKGFRVTERPGEVSFDTWFEGRLTTEIRFVTQDGFPRW
ncbi:hypothetical protein [Pelomicrobium sp.]|uniref:hypothetical protein n=1 Tax=Pelomicrobium sp. TaxID=2815319 RepID=UPI002FDE712D